MQNSAMLAGSVWGTATVLTMAAAFLVSISHPHSGTRANDRSQPRKPATSTDRTTPPANEAKLKSPLLQGLKQSILESEGFEKSDPSASLLEQLDNADQRLTALRAQNKDALKQVNRQVRIGAAKRSPNILLVTFDRLGWTDLGCFGQKTICTPHLDRLASEGLRLTQFYAGGADAKAARWCLLTGRASSRVQTNREDRFRIHDEHVTVAEVLWDAGYSTAFFGLWTDSDRPTRHGFENWSGHLHPTELHGGYPEILYVDETELKIVDNKGAKPVHELNQLLIGELTSWLNQATRQKRQFFAHFAITMFSDDAVLTRSSAEYRQRVEAADSIVGQLLDVLDKSQVSKSTCIVACAESGPSSAWQDATTALRSSKSLRLEDHGLAEGNLRVPAIVRWPGHVPADDASDAVSGTWDVLPSLAELAVASRQPSKLDGVSLIANWRSKKPVTRGGMLYWEYGDKRIGQAVRLGNWKGVRPMGESALQLFDVVHDSAEENDRAGERPEIVQRMIVK